MLNFDRLKVRHTALDKGSDPRPALIRASLLNDILAFGIKLLCQMSEVPS